MKISFSPQLRGDSLTLDKTAGDRLRINGELFNFDPVPEGGYIPHGEVPSEWIVGPVARVEGQICLTLHLPYHVSRMGIETPEAIEVVDSGPIELPRIDPEESADVDA